jgi:hypothetical protein
MFRNCIKADLKLSDRLKATGLQTVALDVLKYCFSGEPFLPPPCARELLEELVCPEHSLCRIKIRGKKITHV